jgi:hypothetical protein
MGMTVKKQSTIFDWRWLLAIPLLIAALAILIYAWTFSHLPHNQDPGAWGTFGDYFGGLLNPVVSTLTLFVAVAVWQLQREAIALQRSELEETRAVLAEQAQTGTQQREEQRFFDFLNIYLRTVDSITWRGDEGRDYYKGREAIRQWSHDRLEERGHCATSSFLKNGLENTYTKDEGFLIRNWPKKEHIRDDFTKEVDFLYPYFRTVFRLLSDADQLFKDESDLYRYMKLFRAQLSDEELQALALNVWLTKPGIKMRPIANKHGLLKHLPEGPLRKCIAEELLTDFPSLLGNPQRTQIVVPSQ